MAPSLHIRAGAVWLRSNQIWLRSNQICLRSNQICLRSIEIKSDTQPVKVESFDTVMSTLSSPLLKTAAVVQHLNTNLFVQQKTAFNFPNGSLNFSAVMKQMHIMAYLLAF